MRRHIDNHGWRFLFLLLLSLHITSCSEHDNEKREGIDIDSIDNPDYPISDDALLIRAINQNCKYVLTEWWNEPKDVAFQNSYLPNWQPLTSEQEEEVMKGVESFQNWSTEECLFIPNWKKNGYSENAILPPCYACRILSSAIHYGLYDERVTGISKDEAVKKAVLLISSLTKYHCSNSENGWGNCWQGALWAETLGMSAYLIKDYLSAEDWNMICNMIRSECDYVVQKAGVKVYKDRLGHVQEGREGDSQSETDAWNASILALGITAIPDDINRESWRERFIELNIAAMTCPSDVFHYDWFIDGYCFIDAYGSNINEDGTVTNHNKLHIDYMASPIESFAESAIALSFSSDNLAFDCLKFNVDKVYNALVDLDLGEFNTSKAGHHFYERTMDGEASSDTNMPEDNEWGNNRQANYYLVDTYVSLIGADSALPEQLKADKWAHCRLEKIVEMMGRDNSGRIYQDGEENFASGQLYAMACLTQVYSLLKGDLIGKKLN